MVDVLLKPSTTAVKGVKSTFSGSGVLRRTFCLSLLTSNLSLELNALAISSMLVVISLTRWNKVKVCIRHQP